MKTTKIKTSFDCLDFKQSSQAKMAEEMKNLSYLEQVDYLNRKIKESDLNLWWETLSNK
jgi:hypothetical protein